MSEEKEAIKGIEIGVKVDLLDSSGKPIQGIVEGIKMHMVPVIGSTERAIAIKVRAVPYQGGVYKFFYSGDPFAHLPGKERMIGVVEETRDKRFKIQTVEFGRYGRLGLVEVER